MRLALLSDIHANLVALEAVIADARRIAVDEIVCLGDVATLGPEPRKVIALLQSLGCHAVAGNHESFLLHPELVAAYSDAPPVIDAIAWCRDALSREDLDYLASFVPTLEIPLDGAGSLFAFHGTPTSNTTDLLVTTTGAVLDGLLGATSASVVACGHTHLQMLRQHRGTLLVNPGSVGMPFKEFAGGRTPTVLSHAEYAVVEVEQGTVSVRLRRVAVDRGAMRRACQGWGTPLGAWLASQYG